jgi:raffinose/stachyose/melibiose transport system substrate-binding protein
MSVQRFSRRIMILAAAALLTAATACGDGDKTTTAGVATIDWWHIQNTAPMLPVWQALAAEYQRQHQDVKINITPLENEAFKARLTTVTQAGDPPDIFHTWGGGVLKQQVEAGLVKDITADVAPWIGSVSPTALEPYKIDGKIYGIPFDLGMVGFWYNKAHFRKAGITEPPRTWSELLDAVGKLKAAGITPIALAGQAKWPGHFYWSYLAMRLGGADAIRKAAAAKSFDGPEFVEAGRHLKELVDLQPFQQGFLAAPFDTPDGEAAAMGNGQVAMELQGQFAPGVQREQSGKDLGADLGFFPFPEVEGGKGVVTDVFGGGNGFAIGRDAPPAAVDFLKFISQADNHRKAVATGVLLPVIEGTEDAVEDPAAKAVATTLAKATGFQLYLDQAFAPAVGQTVNDSVAALIAGTMSAEDVTKAITEAARNQ